MPTTATYLSFPYDAEIFNYDWKNTPDLVLTSIFDSGAVVQDSEISNMIASGSNFFTVPYYDVLGGNEQNYDGATNFTYDSISAGSYSGCVFSRMKAWNAKSFIKDFNSGADPMAQIVTGVSQYWHKKRQARLIAILGAVFGISGDTDWATHTTNIATATSTVADANKIGVTTLSDAITKSNGDNAGGYSLAIMHSTVASRLANLQLLEFSKYTDASGMTRSLPIGTANGLTVIVNDNVPVDTKITYAITADVAINASKTYYTRSGSAGAYVYAVVASPDVANIATYYEKSDAADEYTTFILGSGAIRYASAPVDLPSEMKRDPETNGGMDMIYTRVREVLAPYGFSFKGDVTTNVAVPDAVLHASASYERKMPAKSIFMTKLVTNG